MGVAARVALVRQVIRVKTFMRLLLFFQLAVMTELALAAAEVEFNNTPETANALTVGVTMNAQLYSAADIDYFKIASGSSGTFTIASTGYVAARLEILNSARQVIGAGRVSYSDGITFSFDSPGTFFFKVYPDSDSYYSITAPYSLTVTASASITGEIERNNTPSTANTLSNDVTMRGHLYNFSDIDYFKVPTNSSGTLVVTANLPFAVIEVMNSGQQVIAGSTVWGVETLMVGFNQPGPYFFKIYNAAPNDNFLYEPYSLNVIVESSPGTPEIASVYPGDGEIDLHVADATDGISVSQYDATCTDGSNTFSDSSVLSPLTVTGLTNGVTYICTVTATNAQGTSEPSAPTEPITPEAIIPGLPIWLLYQISGQSGGNDDGVNTHTVTASAGTGGSISPSGARTVNEGGTVSFTLAASSGYSVSGVSGTCPSGSLSGTIYTTGAITQSCTVVANFYATNESGYCSDTPADVICDPNSDGRSTPGGTMDDWESGAWGLENTPIPNGKVVAYPFLANAGAAGSEGIMEFSNNMPDLTSTDYMWKGWFSETPGGAVLNNNDSYCRKYSPNPNPQQMRWSQSATPSRFACNLGQSERVLYFNMAVECYEEVLATVPLDQRDCTVGVPFPGVGGYPSYYIKVYPQ